MSKDPYQYFRIEARELLQGLSQGILELERGSADPQRVGALLRWAHTLKGAARVVKQPAIAELAHALESGLEPFRHQAQAVPAAAVAELLRLADGIAARLAALGSPASAAAGSPRPAAAPAAPAGDEPARTPEEVFETVRVEVEEVNAVLDSLAQASVHLTAIRQRAQGLRHARGLARGLLPTQAAAPAATRGSAAGLEELVAVLDGLDRDLAGAIEPAERELSQARERAEQLRLLAAGMMFPALERAVRDAALALDKRVECALAGADLRVEAQVLLVLRHALLHLVNNAVAHGIEAPAARVAAGKPEAGRIELRVERRGADIAFLCRDDGAGLDLAAIRRVAAERGVLAPEQAAALGWNEAVALVLRGGLSTAKTITEVSGRGIGLDVVRAAAARLRGELSMESAPGRGTTFELRVPVSLTALPALLVQAGGAAVFLPLEAVRQTLRVEGATVAGAEAHPAIAFQGAMIPFLPLSQALGLGPAAPRAQWPTVVMASGATLFAVGVDSLHGLETALVRRLPPEAAADPLVAGASLDSAGNPRLVLDPMGLAARVSRGQPVVPIAAVPHPILVVDDSLTTRMLEQSILESAGHAVELATSAEEALEKAALRRYSLFLVDVEMPGMDGFQFVARTRADPALRSVPAILVSSRNAPEDLRRGKEVGAAAYMVKSEFDQDFLLRTIRQLVDRP